MQAANKTIAQYTVALRKLSCTYNFVCPEPTCKKSIAQVFLQVQFITGLSDSTIREKLLQENDLTFGNATKIALALEASKLENRYFPVLPRGNNHIATVNNTLLEGDNKLTVSIKIGSGTILFEIDTGSPISIISEQVFREACSNVNLNPSAMTFRTFTGEVLRPLGIAKVQISYENKTSEEDIYVISALSSPLLGRLWLQHLNIDVNRLLCNSVQNVNTTSYLTASKLKDQILKKYSQTFSEKIDKVH
ncbi:hypothetical protein ILUMI_15136 [Ignelater luminosus]|uniref:Retropepsins domain-containing protein n=1 Tax=Ignelater luminosus TaxID=2038154 RepID=A0A8K0CV93_IGNLU|nr:hypothetical protein ILUMI_15136 [Ignelater luminosus]